MPYIFSILFFALFSLSACAHEPADQVEHIAVVGSGVIEQEPDQATLNVSINAREADLVQAKAVADSRYRKVLNVIDDAGIKSSSVKANQIIAQPEYEWRNGKRIYKGELVSRSLSIKVDDLSLVSGLMQALVENDVSSIDGITTGFKDRSALMQKALTAAADDARSKAGFLAERLGRSLGAAYQITEHNTDSPQMYRAEMAMASRAKAADAPPPEMFGTQKVTARVNVSFYLL